MTFARYIFICTVHEKITLVSSTFAVSASQAFLCLIGSGTCPCQCYINKVIGRLAVWYLKLVIAFWSRAKTCMASRGISSCYSISTECFESSVILLNSCKPWILPLLQNHLSLSLSLAGRWCVVQCQPGGRKIERERKEKSFCRDRNMCEISDVLI